MYPLELVTPMAKDLTDFGFSELNTAEQVDQEMANKEGTMVLVINSVCGCAAANARPGAKLALQNEKRPTRAFTVFAGVHKEATERARDYLLPYPPSSPAIAIFKDGKLAHMLERHQIEGNTAEAIAGNLKQAFDHFC